MAERVEVRDDSTCGAIRRNIEAIAALEESFNRNRTVGDRIADGISGFAGSLKFVALHIAILGVWIATNLGAIPFLPKFDPYPFMLLAMTVSMEAIFLSTFVLIKQNRMSRRADQRAHLGLQINLLAEREMTLVLQMLQTISGRLGVRSRPGELEELSAETSVEALASELNEKLPE